MPREMTALPKKLKQGGYATHMVGKWHVGTQNWGQIPVGRGFDTSFHYMDGAEDHWTQGSCIDEACGQPSQATSFNAGLDAAGWKGNSIDLWCTDKPCWGRNGTTFHMGRNGQVVADVEHYGDHMFGKEACRIIKEHDPTIPLFFYIAFQNNHEPLEAPDAYIERYPASWREDRRWCTPPNPLHFDMWLILDASLTDAGMTTFWDEVMGNVTQQLREKNMWDDLLIIATTDNGGPVYWTPPDTPDYLHGGGANNWPLRSVTTAIQRSGQTAEPSSAGVRRSRRGRGAIGVWLSCLEVSCRWTCVGRSWRRTFT